MYLERVTEVMNINPGLDETFGFLSQALHRHLVKFVFNLDIRIANGWSTHHMELDCMSAYILETQLSELWSLLNRTGDTQRNAKAIITTKPLTKQDSHLYLQDLGSSGNDYDTNQPESVTETVVISEAPINAFAINPIQRSDVVFVTSYGINEVDATVSCNYFTNTSAPREISIQEYLPQSENNAISRLAMSRTPSLSGAAPAMKRDISLDSINQLLKRSFQTSAAQGVTKTTDKGLRLRRTTGQATTLESHKSLNYYLGGLGDSSSPEVVVQLYQYGQQQEIVSYSTISEGKLIKCHFDPYGAKFAGADSRGDVHIWKFDAAPSSIRPCLTLRQCHQGTISDFTFLNSSSILATAGLSANSMNICIWDTLLPPSRARVKSFQVGEAGIKSILYSAEHNILVAGGRKGNIFVLDMRQDISLLNTFPAHESMITSIALDRQSNLICSGSSRGKIKLFDINALHLEVPTENNMPLPVLDEGVGVVDIQVYNNDYYTCYANGTIFKTTKLDRI
ncbi:WD40-repeat-containing domain protein [Globomyces pollinis-pini]|nr:WD40-repeat-containing domain protein [Globomyces pollinis-pini]